MNVVDKLHILNTYGKVVVNQNKMDATYEAFIVGNALVSGVGHTMTTAIDSLYMHVMRYMLSGCNLLLT